MTEQMQYFEEIANHTYPKLRRQLSDSIIELTQQIDGDYNSKGMSWVSGKLTPIYKTMFFPGLHKFFPTPERVCPIILD